MQHIRRWLSLRFAANKPSHSLCLLLGLLPILLMLATLLPVLTPHVAYPSKTLSAESAYVQQTDAFLKGQIHLDIAPSEELLSLENPYENTAERETAGYLWDRALYDGRYYSYFGVAPVFTVYLPYYAIFGALPSLLFVCLVLSLGATAAMTLTYRELLVRFGEGVSLPLATVGLTAFLFASGLLLGTSYADTYYVAVLSAMGCFFAFSFFLLWGIRQSSAVLRSVSLSFSALFLVLVVASRPTAALMSLCLIPLIWGEIKQAAGERRCGSLLLSSIGFWAVLFVGAVAIMLYNEARFDSPLEFGARYQLTVSDVSQNTVTLSLLGLSFYHYFIQPPAAKELFPHLGLRFSLIGSPERYLYRASTVGTLFLGTPAGILLAPVSRTVRRNPTLFSMLLSCGALSLLIAFLNTCLGGVNLRYATDFLPMISALGVLSCLLVTRDSQKKHRLMFIALSLILFAMGIVLMLGILRNNPYGRLLGAR